MAEPAVDDHPVAQLDEPANLSMTARTKHVDRVLNLLADRRRRFCLYHLRQADGALEPRGLAERVESSLAPADGPVTERTIEDAVLVLLHTHLPKLRDAGLVRLDDRRVELASDPPFPLRDWLDAAAAVEHGSAADGLPVTAE